MFQRCLFFAILNKPDYTVPIWLLWPDNQVGSEVIWLEHLPQETDAAYCEQAKGMRVASVSTFPQVGFGLLDGKKLRR
jgi:hypothetical protein